MKENCIRKCPFKFMFIYFSFIREEHDMKPKRKMKMKMEDSQVFISHNLPKLLPLVADISFFHFSPPCDPCRALHLMPSIYILFGSIYSAIALAPVGIAKQ